MAKAIMIQGTTSNAGKSFLAAALCRIFAQDGYRVAPFKSQNMALNSYITDEGLEMGRAQVMQAEAAGVKPSVRMNPILLKPTGDTGSQVIVNGEVQGNMTARAYFAMKRSLFPQVMAAYHALAAEHDIIVIEGAGSPAEINLKQDDIVNMGMAARCFYAGTLTGGACLPLYTVRWPFWSRRSRPGFRALSSTNSGGTRPFWTRGWRCWRSSPGRRWWVWCRICPWTWTMRTPSQTGSSARPGGAWWTLR